MLTRRSQQRRPAYGTVGRPAPLTNAGAIVANLRRRRTHPERRHDIHQAVPNVAEVVDAWLRT